MVAVKEKTVIDITLVSNTILGFLYIMCRKKDFINLLVLPHKPHKLLKVIFTNQSSVLTHSRALLTTVLLLFEQYVLHKRHQCCTSSVKCAVCDQRANINSCYKKRGNIGNLHKSSFQSPELHTTTACYRIFFN